MRPRRGPVWNGRSPTKVTRTSRAHIVRSAARQTRRVAASQSSRSVMDLAQSYGRGQARGHARDDGALRGRQTSYLQFVEGEPRCGAETGDERCPDCGHCLTRRLDQPGSNRRGVQTVRSTVVESLERNVRDATGPFRQCPRTLPPSAGQSGQSPQLATAGSSRESVYDLRNAPRKPVCDC